jgi:hypothetical protein
VALSAAALTARADTYTWADPTVSGTWDATTLANWLVSGSIPTVAPGTADDVVISSDTGVIITLSGVLAPNINTLTVNSGATLLVTGGNRGAFATGIINAGLMYVTGTRPFAQLPNGQGTLTVTNTGTITLAAGSLLSLAGQVTNTGGRFDVQAGGALNVVGMTLLQGGILDIASGASVIQNDVQAIGGFKLENVTISNHSQWVWSSMTGGGGRNKEMTVSGGAFDNAGLFTLSQLGDVVNGGSGYGRNLSVYVKDNNSFTNSGTIAISNSTPDVSPGNEYAQFVVSAGGTLTNSGRLTVSNAATNTETNVNTSQYALLSIAADGEFINTGTVSVSLDDAVADETFHYATLFIGKSWVNDGAIIVSAANKIAASAKLDVRGDYTQSAPGAALLVADGGLASVAGNLTVSGGVLGGAGRIAATGAITVSDGLLDPDGTLRLSNLTLSPDAVIEFNLDTDLLNIDGALALNDATLNLTHSALADGSYLLANYGALVNDALTISGRSDYNYALNFTTSGKIFLDLTAIPEPSAWALLATGGALLAWWRRRRD